MYTMDLLTGMATSGAENLDMTVANAITRTELAIAENMDSVVGTAKLAAATGIVVAVDNALGDALPDWAAKIMGGATLISGLSTGNKIVKSARKFTAEQVKQQQAKYLAASTIEAE